MMLAIITKIAQINTTGFQTLTVFKAHPLALIRSRLLYSKSKGWTLEPSKFVAVLPEPKPQRQPSVSHRVLVPVTVAKAKVPITPKEKAKAKERKEKERKVEREIVVAMSTTLPELRAGIFSVRGTAGKVILVPFLITFPMLLALPVHGLEKVVAGISLSKITVTVVRALPIPLDLHSSRGNILVAPMARVMVNGTLLSMVKEKDRNMTG